MSKKNQNVADTIQDYISKKFHIQSELFTKHKSKVIGGIIAIGIAIIAPSIIQYATNNIVYGNIPTLYEETMMYKGEPSFVLYVDNTKTKIDFVQGYNYDSDDTYDFTFHKGLVIETPKYEGEVSLGGYALIESESPDFEIDELTLQEKIDRFLDDLAEMKHTKEGQSHIFYGGMVEGEKNAYDTKLFNLVNNKTAENTFLAVGLDRNIVHGFNGKYSDSFTDGITQSLGTIHTHLFSFDSILDRIFVYNEFIVLMMTTIERIANYEYVAFTATKEDKQLVLKYDVIGDDIIVDEVIAKSMCSKAKTVHLESKEIEYYKLKGMECEYTLSDNNISIIITYNDFEAHLKSAQ